MQNPRDVVGALQSLIIEKWVANQAHLCHLSSSRFSKFPSEITVKGQKFLDQTKHLAVGYRDCMVVAAKEIQQGVTFSGTAIDTLQLFYDHLQNIKANKGDPNFKPEFTDQEFEEEFEEIRKQILIQIDRTEDVKARTQAIRTLFLKVSETAIACRKRMNQRCGVAG
jgi:hypothetical protein